MTQDRDADFPEELDQEPALDEEHAGAPLADDEGVSRNEPIGEDLGPHEVEPLEDEQFEGEDNEPIEDRVGLHDAEGGE